MQTEEATQISYIGAAKLAELANSAKKKGCNYVQVQSKSLLAVGADPLNPTHVIDLTKESIRPISGQVTPPDPETPPAPTPRRASRRSGKYSIEIKGNMTECVSLKEVLAEGLKAFEIIRPGTLDELTKIMPRSKRIVSRDPKQLFKNPEMVRMFSEKLVDGWWFGINNSAAETLTWLRRGADIAGLEWGKDGKTSFG